MAWKKQLRTQALNEGLTEEFLDEVIPRMTLLPHVVESDKKQPEFQLTFWTYLDKTVTPLRIQKGQEMLRLHHKTLKAAEKKYKVPAKYIVAFWGFEDFTKRKIIRYHRLMGRGFWQFPIHADYVSSLWGRW